MNHLVLLDAMAGELEKILSGTKTMLIKEFDPTHPATQPVRPGDSLYFLRDQDDYALRVKATVVRVLCFTNCLMVDLSQTLKEMQPRLQLTEEQYDHWTAKRQVLLIEIESAQKINLVRVAPEKVTDMSDWIPFEALSLLI